MSTHCAIFYQNEEGKYQGVHVWFDGYIEYMGNLLLQHYNDEEKVKQIIELGHIYSLQESLNQCPFVTYYGTYIYNDIPYYQRLSRERQLKFGNYAHNALKGYTLAYSRDLPLDDPYGRGKPYDEEMDGWCFDSREEVIQFYQETGCCESAMLYIFDSQTKAKKHWSFFQKNRKGELSRYPLTQKNIEKFSD